MFVHDENLEDNSKKICVSEFFTISHILKDMQLAVLRSQRLNVSLESSTYIALLFHLESLPAFTIIVLQ